MGHFKEYSKYYDLLYKDKDYQKEADYIDKVIQTYSPQAKNLLDIGCGTGKHLYLIVEQGLQPIVDLTETMLCKYAFKFIDYFSWLLFEKPSNETDMPY